MALEPLKADLNIIQELVIPSLDDDLNVIQKLDDEPNDVGGLTAAELKAKFDKAGNLIKDYINDSLLPGVSDTVAEAEVRAAAEQERVANENTRITNEEARESTETERQSSETTRQSNETARQSAESQRAANETARVTAESGRAAAEAARVTAESRRQTAESQRQTNETARQANETQRQSNESARQASEAAREAAEQARANETAGIVAQATAQAQAAGSSAASAGGSAAQAAASASAAELAREQAATSAGSAAVSASAAEQSENGAYLSEQAAAGSQTAAAGSAALSQSWAVGGTGTREGEDTNNAKYYAEHAREIVGGDFVTMDHLIAAVKNSMEAVDSVLSSSLTTAIREHDDSSSAHSERFGYIEEQVENLGAYLEQSALTFDSSPTSGSTNPVTSGGVKTALDRKQNTLTFDSTPISGSTNPVTSGGVFSALEALVGAVGNVFLPGDVRYTVRATLGEQYALCNGDKVTRDEAPGYYDAMLNNLGGVYNRWLQATDISTPHAVDDGEVLTALAYDEKNSILYGITSYPSPSMTSYKLHALYASTDDGKTWAYKATTPKMSYAGLFCFLVVDGVVLIIQNGRMYSSGAFNQNWFLSYWSGQEIIDGGNFGEGYLVDSYVTGPVDNDGTPGVYFMGARTSRTYNTIVTAFQVKDGAAAKINSFTASSALSAYSTAYLTYFPAANRFVGLSEAGIVILDLIGIVTAGKTLVNACTVLNGQYTSYSYTMPFVMDDAVYVVTKTFGVKVTQSNIAEKTFTVLYSGSSNKTATIYGAKRLASGEFLLVGTISAIISEESQISALADYEICSSSLLITTTPSAFLLSRPTVIGETDETFKVYIGVEISPADPLSVLQLGFTLPKINADSAMNVFVKIKE